MTPGPRVFEQKPHDWQRGPGSVKPAKAPTPKPKAAPKPTIIALPREIMDDLALRIRQKRKLAEEAAAKKLTKKR
jgi:hypothetical protein